MAQTTSALWKSLWRMKNTQREYAFSINNVWYGSEAEVEHSVDYGLYEDFGIGNASSATLNLRIYASEIPRGATIKRYVRLRNGNQISEWLPKGVFIVNRRPNKDGLWDIEAFDEMMKAEIIWTPKKGFTFPCTMEAAAKDIAESMGVELDERNVFLPYTMDAYPAGDYSRRDALKDIAAAHGGNWIMSDAGKLRLVPLLSFPPETNYLVEEYGGAITFGGTSILVDSGTTNGALPADGSKHYVGLDVTDFTDNGKYLPITCVTLQVDGDNVITAGDHKGMELYALCPYATQEMVTKILVQVLNFQYRAYSAEEANIDPAAELGDGVDVGGIYSVIARFDDRGNGYAGLSAPGEVELEDEYPTITSTNRELSNDIDSLRAFVAKSLGEMQLQIATLTGLVENLTIKVESISTKVTELDSRVSKLEGGN